MVIPITYQKIFFLTIFTLFPKLDHLMTCDHIQLPRGLKMISNSLPLLNYMYPFNNS